MELQPIQTDRAPIPRGPYNQAIRAGDTIYVSGQIPVDPATNQLVEGDAGVEARQVFENIKAILAEAGLPLADIVRINAYVTDRAYLRAYMDVRDKLFADPAPASTLMIVSGFARPEFKVEIEVIAAG